LTPSIERTPVTLGGDVGDGRYRILAKAEVVLRTGKAAEGTISGDEMKAIIQRRLAETPPRVPPAVTPVSGTEQN
jgi:hypothetical protein